MCNQVIISSGNERKFIVPFLGAGFLSVAVGVIFVPLLQHNGAALAYIAGELAVNVLLLRTSRKIVKAYVEDKFLLTILIGTVMMCLSVCGICRMVENSVLSLVLSVLIGVCVYMTISCIGGKLISKA